MTPETIGVTTRGKGTRNVFQSTHKRALCSVCVSVAESHKLEQELNAARKTSTQSQQHAYTKEFELHTGAYIHTHGDVPSIYTHACMHTTHLSKLPSVGDSSTMASFSMYCVVTNARVGENLRSHTSQPSLC